MKVAILTVDAREHFKDYHRPLPYFGTAPEALLQGFAHLPEVEVHVVACVRKPVQFEQKLAPNVFYHGLLLPGAAWGKTFYMGCVLATRRKLRELKPDIVHGHGTERDCALAACLSGFPNLLTIHGNMRQIAKVVGAPPFSYLWIQCILEAMAVRRSGGVICLTNYTRAFVADQARRTWILPNAVNESFFDVQRAPEINSNILCVANIEPRKNQNFLIRALDPVAAANGMRLVFLGADNPGDPYSQEFHALIKERPWCVYEGYKRGDPMKAHQAAARMTILPSLEENCPMVALESMTIGTPLAAARSGGTPDLVEDGVTGLLFDPEDAGGIRNAALKLFNDTAYARQLAEAGKKRAREKHHPIAIARRHMEIYREALNTRS